MKNLSRLLLLFATFSMGHLQVQAGELDDNSMPEGVLVQVQAESGKVQIFKVKEMNADITDEKALEIIKESRQSENLIDSVEAIEQGSELDNGSSTQAWRYYYRPSYRGWYSYNYYYSPYTYSYSYYPSYYRNYFSYNTYSYSYSRSYNYGGYYYYYYCY